MSKKTLTVEDLKKEMKEKGHKVINHISVGLYAKEKGLKKRTKGVAIYEHQEVN